MDTLRLTLLRHGQAEAMDSCPEDFERVLTRRGSLEAREMAARLVQRNRIPDLILVSPAERTWATASIIAEFCELDAKHIQCARELYLAAAETTWRVITRRAAACRHVLVCGHNPGLSHVASRLGPTPERRDLPTAGLASAVWLNAAWEDLQPEMAQACEWDDPEGSEEL